MKLIDADKLHLKLLDMEFPIQDQDVIFDAMDDCAVYAAPVVHGRWIGEEINIETGDIFATLQECSVCHRIRPVDVFCAHCGAKMDLPKDGE